MKRVYLLDEFVSSLDQIWRNVTFRHLLTNGSSAVNGCRQNESPKVIHTTPVHRLVWIPFLCITPSPYLFPLDLCVHVRVRANSGFDRGVGVRGRGRYPLKPRIFASLLETKRYPEHTAARSSREYFRLKLFIKKLQQSCFVLYTVL